MGDSEEVPFEAIGRFHILYDDSPRSERTVLARSPGHMTESRRYEKLLIAFNNRRYRVELAIEPLLKANKKLAT
jgi:hypothetical protein